MAAAFVAALPDARVEARREGHSPDGAPAGAFAMCLLGDGFETEDFELEASLALAEDAQLRASVGGGAPRGVTWSTLPARPAVATVVQAGGPDRLFAACAAVARHVEAHGYRVVGAPREVFVTWPLPAAREDAGIESRFTVA